MAIQPTQYTLQGADIRDVTSLQFGPDGRLYASQADGLIKAYTIVKTATGYAVAATETIDLVQRIVNHNDDGSVNALITTRQVTGILVTGTPTNPVLYVSSSDPRIGAGPNLGDTNLDTNSGVISRLTLTPQGWEKVDLVRGLPRSEENHATNGMHLDEATGTLYVTSGGHTNAGAPSHNFAYTPEYALSAAILKVDLDAINAMATKVDVNGAAYKYDIPTVDDPTRPNNPDGTEANDVWGGNDGLNQARLMVGGPVQVFSPGFRNAYDLVVTANGMYTFDNGANPTWGGVPINEGTPNVTNQPNDTTGQTNNAPGLYFVTDRLLRRPPEPDPRQPHRRRPLRRGGQSAHAAGGLAAGRSLDGRPPPGRLPAAGHGERRPVHDARLGQRPDRIHVVGARRRHERQPARGFPQHRRHPAHRARRDRPQRRAGREHHAQWPDRLRPGAGRGRARRRPELRRHDLGRQLRRRHHHPRPRRSQCAARRPPPTTTATA